MLDSWASRGGLFVLVALTIPSTAFARSFGPDTTSTGVNTGTPTELHCSTDVLTSYSKCSGFLASDVDGTALDITVTVPPVTTLPPGVTAHPVVAYVHGYGGSKTSDSSYDDMLASHGFVVLRHSTRGFGNSYGQVNLSDINVEVADLRSLIGQLVDAAPALGFEVNPDAVAVGGASYGGGHSWLAAVTPRFTSPRNKTPIRIRTVVPIASWTDLLAALRPNGRPENSIDTPGFFKLSFLQALFIGGCKPLFPDCENYPEYFWEWDTYGLTTEPNNSPPIGSAMVDGLAGYRSVFWQQDFWKAVRANKGTAEQLPILLIQGWTDDLFPLPEALRMYQNLRSIDPNYPVAAYLGDIGHPRAANKPAEIDYALQLLLSWLDFYLNGVGTPSSTCGAAAPQLRCDVLAAITRSGAGFDPNDVIEASSYEALSTATAAVKFGGSATITFDPANFSGYFADPVVITGCEEFGSSCTAPAPDVIPGDVATYTARASDLAASAGVSAPSFLIAGQPIVTFTATSAAPRIQLDARLYDVKPDGTRLLVTRGTFTVDAGYTAIPPPSIGSADVKLVTYGNLWQVGTDDLVQLELTNVDTPYIEPSRIPSVTTLSNVKLTVPVR
jgi:predicted acyl esterase